MTILILVHHAPDMCFFLLN